MKVFMIHGAYGDPNENWFPWLRDKLRAEGHEVIVPEFPTPENQTLEAWLNVFEQYQVNEDTVFVGHSLGVAFILSLVEKYKVKACFFVAGFLGEIGIQAFDEINESFVNKQFDWEKIRNNCSKFYVYHSDNDPYVPLSKGHELAAKLSAEFRSVEGAGHFNEKAGYVKFEELYGDIRGLLC